MKREERFSRVFIKDRLEFMAMQQAEIRSRYSFPGYSGMKSNRYGKQKAPAPFNDSG
jgi:hypothetical protein